MKKIILVASAILAFTAFAQSCEHCKGRGVIEATIQCPLCCGYGNLSPAWFNLSPGETRWTETTYWTGLQTKSNYRHKMFSFKVCPMCQRSKRPGSITWIHICACPMGKNAKVKVAAKSARAKVKSKCKQMGVSTEGLDTGDDEYAINLAAWMVRWQLPPKLFKKLLHEVVNNEFDTKGAHYKREESKYTEKKFKDNEEQDIPKGSRMAKDDSDEKKDENSDEAEKSNEITSTTGSYIAPKMFKASMPKMKPVEYVCECEIDDSYYGIFSRCQETHWSVRIRAYNSAESNYEIFHGYAAKTSSIGKEISSILSDGKEHKLTLIIRYKPAEYFSSAVEIVGMK